MTKGFEDYTVGKIRETLVNNGYTEEEALAVKGKSNLIFHLQELAEKRTVDVHLLLNEEAVSVDEMEDISDIDLSNAEDVPDVIYDFDKGCEPGVLATPQIPDYASPEWSQYVLSQFEDYELMDGNPTVSGLRRVAEVLLGEIMFSSPVKMDAYHPDDANVIGRSSCMYQVKIAWKFGISPYVTEQELSSPAFNLPVRTFGACAGSFLGNTDDVFAIYPEAIAETRAESRALRKALCLTNVVSHEELTGKDSILAVNMSKKPREKVVDTSSLWGDDSLSSIQKTHITTKCKQLDIDVDKFVNLEFYEGRSDEKRYGSLDEVDRETAAAMVKELNRFQSEAGPESRKIPNSILLEKTDDES